MDYNRPVQNLKLSILYSEHPDNTPTKFVFPFSNSITSVLVKDTSAQSPLTSEMSAGQENLTCKAPFIRYAGARCNVPLPFGIPAPRDSGPVTGERCLACA